VLHAVRVRTPLLLGLLTTTALLAGAVHPATARADASGPQPLVLAATGPDSLTYRGEGVLTVTLGPPEAATAAGTLHVESTPAGGGDTDVLLDQVESPSVDPVQVPIVGDVSRTYVVSFVPLDPTQWTAPDPVTVEVPVGAATTVATLTVVGLPAAGAAVVPGPYVWRSFGAVATVRLVDADGAPVVGADVTLQQRSIDTKNAWASVRTVQTGSVGAATVQVVPWYNTVYRVVYAGQSGRLEATQSAELLVRPSTPGRRVAIPAGSPQPTGATQTFGRGYGVGANAVVTAIPDKVWATMLGYSYSATAHCPVGRTKLSYVTINYWGFDGNRYRGELVVAKARAAAFAKAFTVLYNLHFPIRSMVRPDRFGHSPHGWPGANDYLSMAHDNTYGFNCRYVVGREAARVMSPHAYGYAVDVNTWENPDVAANGTHPNSWFAVHRSAKYGGVIMSGSAIVLAFREIGLGWGGSTISDYQHFDPTLL
jgi:hypothetical protein